MIIVMHAHALPEEVQAVVDRVGELGLKPHLSTGTERTIIGAIGEGTVASQYQGQFIILPGVDRVIPISRPYKLASREFCPENTQFTVGQSNFGGNEIVMIAGPCSVESYSQTLEVAFAVKEAGATILRGGAYKPRSSPYSFQGLGEEGLEILAQIRQETGLPVITEVMAPEQVNRVASYADMLQVGARNMQNFPLLNAVGESQHPVLLKRGLSATTEELLMAAEYILARGSRRVAICERGIRTFETATRNTTDINAIPVLKLQTHLPVLLDPSHSTGNWQYVSAVARAGVAAGADGLIVEVHSHPEKALSDGGQSLKPERYAEMVRQVRLIAQAVGRSLKEPAQAEQPAHTI